MDNSLNYSENSSNKLVIEGDRVRFKDMGAFTTKAISEIVKKRNETNPLPRLIEPTRNTSIHENMFACMANMATIAEVMKNPENMKIQTLWDENNELSIAYYKEASLEEIIARYTNTSDIKSFLSLTGFGEEVELEDRLIKLIWEKNPELAIKYDGFNQITRITEVEKNNKRKLDKLKKKESKSEGEIRQMEWLEKEIKRRGDKPWMYVS